MSSEERVREGTDAIHTCASSTQERDRLSIGRRRGGRLSVPARVAECIGVAAAVLWCAFEVITYPDTGKMTFLLQLDRGSWTFDASRTQEYYVLTTVQAPNVLIDGVSFAVLSSGNAIDGAFLELLTKGDSAVLGAVSQRHLRITQRRFGIPWRDPRPSWYWFRWTTWRRSPALVVGRGFPMIVLATTLLPIVVLRLRHCVRVLRGRGSHCTKCGYCLRGNVSGICPECGTPTARRSIEAPDGRLGDY